MPYLPAPTADNVNKEKKGNDVVFHYEEVEVLRETITSWIGKEGNNTHFVAFSVRKQDGGILNCNHGLLTKAEARQLLEKLNTGHIKISLV